MGFLKTVSNGGEINMDRVLIEEGFKKIENHYFYETPIENHKRLTVTIIENRMFCILENSESKEVLNKHEIAYRKDVFLERYFMLLDSIRLIRKSTES